MKFIRQTLLWSLAASIFILFMSGCTAEKKTGIGKPVLAVSILPQQYFLERISAGHVAALVLVGPGQNPHSYDPTPKQMALLAKAGA